MIDVFSAPFLKVFRFFSKFLLHLFSELKHIHILILIIFTACMGESVYALADQFSSTEMQAKASIPAPGFVLTDQYSVSHSLSDYRGKIVFLNFWTTWCPYCIQEMPDIEEIYHELGENAQEYVILGISSPSVYDTANEEEIIDFLKNNHISYPVLMDTTGEYFYLYGASSLPTSWFIRPDGSLIGYINGARTKEQLLDFLKQCVDF